MNVSDLKQRVAGNLNLPADDKQCGPICIAFILGLVEALAQHLVEKCFTKLDPPTIQSPGFLKKRQLWALVKQKAYDLGKDPQFAGQVDAKTILAEKGDGVYQAILKTGAEMSDHERSTVCTGNFFPS